jgi:hypothetical protein
MLASASKGMARGEQMTDKTDELREKLASTIFDICRNCNSLGTKWEHLKNPEAKKAWYDYADVLVDEVLIPAGLVFMDEDQTPPVRMYVKHNPVDSYRDAQKDMVEVGGFRKVTPIKKVE